MHAIPEYRYEIIPMVVEKLGGTINDKHSIDRFWFESGRDEVIRNDFSLEPSRFWPLFREADCPEKRSTYIRAYDDAERTLRRLKQMNKMISIITGSPGHIAQMEIEKLNGAPQDFYFSITDSEFVEKPNAKSFHYVLENLKVKPEETVYIGNSNEDAYYAKNAGVDFIHLDRKEYQFDLKDYVIATIHSLDELFRLKV